MKFLFGQHDVSDRVVADNDLAFAFVTNIPIVPGHILISAKRQVLLYEELTFDEKAAVEDLRIRMKTVLEKTFSAEGFNYAWNENEIGGQSVPHFHLHVIPRKKGDAGVYTYEPREFIYRPGARETSPDQELLEVAELIKTNL